MTIKELKEILAKYPEDKEIVFCYLNNEEDWIYCEIDSLSEYPNDPELEINLEPR